MPSRLQPPLLTLLLLMTCFTPALAQDTAAALTIRFAGGVSHFRIGETVPIELSFSAAVPDNYDLDTRNYDRSGRITLEQFHLSPTARDPLRSYYAHGAIGGGLGGSQVLSSDPVTMREDLNEWIAFDHPGHYHVFVTSSRVSRRGRKGDEALQLQSNSLEFDVADADPQWLEETLAGALSVLKSEGSTVEDKNAALRTLRFLDSPQSIPELVRQLGNLPEGSGFDSLAGLAGSRYQDVVLKELDRQMELPDLAITNVYLNLLAHLKFDRERPPAAPYPEHEPQQQKTWVEHNHREEKIYLEIEDRLFMKAASLVSLKRGPARTKTVRTLLARPLNGLQDVRPIAGLPEIEITSAFVQFSPSEQFLLLSYFWDRIQMPAMLTPLEAILAQPDIHHYRLRDAALRRLYELDPGEATAFILGEIRHPHVDEATNTVSAKTLGLLPDETLPAFDEMLAERVEQKASRTIDLDANLVARYATKAILPRVKAAYESAASSQNCAAADGFVLYFLRVDADYGVRQLATVPSACMTESMQRVIRMKRWDEVEPGVIAQLQGPDLNRARQAAEALSRYGGVKSEKALWMRLRHFHQQWAARENDLKFRHGAPQDATEAAAFQESLIRSLGGAQGWLLSTEQLLELENLALGSQRSAVSQYRWSSPVELYVNILFDGQIQANINRQEIRGDVSSIRAKLAQYPIGTRFHVITLGNQSTLAPVLQAINDEAMTRGLVMEETR